MKLSKSIEGFLIFKRVNLSESTLAGYAVSLAKLQSYLGHDPDISEITPLNIVNFLNYLRDTPQEVLKGVAPRGPVMLSNKSLRNIHVTLSSLWTWAIQSGYTTRHIIREVPRPKAEERAIEPFTRDDIVAILKACETITYTRCGKQVKAKRITAARDKAIVKLLLDTGLRVSELCNARIKDFDARNHRIKVMGKGKKERILLMDVRTAQAIWSYLAKRGEAEGREPLFSSCKRIEFLTRRNLLTVLKRIGNEAGVSHCHPHRFRHTFAINFLRNGGNIYALKEMMGHASLETCERYLAIAQADTETAHRKASPVANWRL